MAALVPWSKKTADESPETPAHVLAHLNMLQAMAESFPSAQLEESPWLAARTEVTRWNPQWFVALMTKPRQLLRFALWVTSHAVTTGVFVAVVLAVVIALLVHFSA